MKSLAFCLGLLVGLFDRRCRRECCRAVRVRLPIRIEPGLGAGPWGDLPE